MFSAARAVSTLHCTTDKGCSRRRVHANVHKPRLQMQYVQMYRAQPRVGIIVELARKSESDVKHVSKQEKRDRRKATGSRIGGASDMYVPAT